jgi:hypothetical protein
MIVTCALFARAWTPLSVRLEKCILWNCIRVDVEKGQVTSGQARGQVNQHTCFVISCSAVSQLSCTVCKPFACRCEPQKSLPLYSMKRRYRLRADNSLRDNLGRFAGGASSTCADAPALAAARCSPMPQVICMPLFVAFAQPQLWRLTRASKF